MNKSVITSLLALLVLMAGYLLDIPWLLSIGLFALSGALTNWLAVHMLFEKVPLLYGSGVIAIKFEEFKAAIRQLMLSQFFNGENLAKVMDSGPAEMDLAPVIRSTDLSPAFDTLLEVVENSSFGGMLGMFGGTAALEPMREPFVEKMQTALIDIAASDQFKARLTQELDHSLATDSLIGTVEQLIDGRLAELTPQLVKQMIQDLIKTHLGWLVVWGGVFGGLFGLLASLF